MFNSLKIVALVFLMICGQLTFAQETTATPDKTTQVQPPSQAEVAQEQVANAPIVESSSEVTIDPRLLAVKNLETLYFDLEITLSKDLSVQEIGVSDLTSISGAVIDAWKKWAQKYLLQFKNVEDFNALNFKEAEQNSKNHTIVFKAHLKKLPRASITGRLDLEVSAQYVVIRLSDRKILTSFDFPNLQRTLDTKVQKELSSKVASLIFNLLNAKTSELNLVLSAQFGNETNEKKDHLFAIKSAQSLLEINKLNNSLRNLNLKATVLCKFESQIKSFSTETAAISLESNCSELNMMEYLKSLGQVEIDNGRVFHFLPNEKSFEIFTVSPHNEKKEMPTP